MISKTGCALLLASAICAASTFPGAPRAALASPQRAPAPAMAAVNVAPDDAWDDRFGKAGKPVIYAMTMAPNGDIYVGGIFSPAVNGIPARNIARWDGRRWNALGDGLDDAVYSIVVSGTAVIASGLFLNAGGVAVSHIAAWNTQSETWSALGAGLDGYAKALAVGGGNLYAGGSFDTAGGTVARNIARWDGASWSALGSGVDNMVMALAWAGNQLYAGGYFEMAGGNPASRLAAWDGGAWSEFNGGAGDAVTSIAPFGLGIAIAGWFTTVGPVTQTVNARSVARWSGSDWSAPGGGIAPPGWAKALAAAGGNLYAAGTFTTAGGIPANHVARWDGAAWTSLGSGLSQTSGAFDASALAADATQVYVGGAFDRAGGVTTPNIARWGSSNGAWSALGQGINDDRVGDAEVSAVVRTLLPVGGDVIAAGHYREAGGVRVNAVSRWSNAAGAWSAVGGGLGGDASVYALAMYGSDLYAGGAFTDAGGVSVANIARWNSASGAWSPLGSGANGFVSAIAAGPGKVYIGGGFQQAGGAPANYLAEWDGVSWKPLGDGVISYGPSVLALELLGDDLFIGGQFTSLSGTIATSIGRWNTLARQYYDIGGVGGCFKAGCLAPRVNALKSNGAELFVAGDFTTAGGVPASGIAAWNGASWSALGAGVNGPIYGIAAGPFELFAAGAFTMAGGAPANHIARWDRVTRAWSALGSGITLDDRLSYPSVNAVALSGGAVYAGGDLIAAGGKPSWHIARWQMPAVVAATIPPAGGGLASGYDNTGYAFASGTFASAAIITHTALLTGAPPTGSLIGISHFYAITATISGSGAPVQPLKPYTVTIVYDPADLGGAYAGGLALYAWDGGQWIKETSSRVNPVSNAVIATPTHFSIWGVLGPARKDAYLPVARR